MGKTLIVTEKPCVAQSIAAVLDAKKRGDGYIEGGGWLISWGLEQLVEPVIVNFLLDLWCYFDCWHNSNAPLGLFHCYYID